GQLIQKKQEEKQIEEEQAANARYWKIPTCCDDDDDDSAITPNEPVDSISMGDEHLDTILATESDEFIKSCVVNLVPNPRTEADNHNQNENHFHMNHTSKSHMRGVEGDKSREDNRKNSD
nr:hypothetical protein [Tanacetum cinerariifolium]